MKNIFTKHPHAVGESYLQHLINASRFSLILFKLAFMSLTHAFLPFLFEHSTSDQINRLNTRLQERKKELEKSTSSKGDH